ncbi:MAG: hypothetical protein ACR2PR_11170 [Pseudohongiellaceae bacterium]
MDKTKPIIRNSFKCDCGAIHFGDCVCGRRRRRQESWKEAAITAVCAIAIIVLVFVFSDVIFPR